VIAVLTLALGIGANATIFSIINGLILNPPLLTDPDRVVPSGRHRRTNGAKALSLIWTCRTGAPQSKFRRHRRLQTEQLLLTDRGEVERFQGMRVTANFFPLLKVNLWRGRNFQSEEDKRGSQPVTIISYEFWQSRFAGDEAALNQEINLNGKQHTIVGILPRGFSFLCQSKTR